MEEKKPCIKILVACHKADPNIRQDDIYMPIQVGKSLHPELDLGFQCDNTGDNISDKNASYCELTALYWAWKNLKDVDYIGLCHYRRYFDFKNESEDIMSILKNTDIIVPKYKVLRTNIITELASLTTWEDAYVLIDEILSILPEAKKSVYEYFYQSNRFSLCNMLITNAHVFDEYCSFLFKLLSNVESRIVPSGYSRVRRVLGYLAEAVLGFWIKYKNLYSKQLYIYSKNSNKFNEFLSSLHSHLIFLFGKKSFLSTSRDAVFFENWLLTGLKNDGIELKNKNIKPFNE